MQYVIWECIQEQCGLRLPFEERELPLLQDKCPRCGGNIQLIGKYSAHGEETTVHLPTTEKLEPTNSFKVAVLLDNLRSTWNVGSIFRSADGAGISPLFLCGITATPENPKVASTALGAHKVLSWTYQPNAYHTALQVREQGWRLWALECGIDDSIIPNTSLFDLPALENELVDAPLLLIIGNERFGIDPNLLKLCERAVWIPMKGYKGSLNVAVAFSITAFWLRFGHSSKIIVK